MSVAAESIKALLAPLLPDWSLQFGHWRDPGQKKRSALLRPVGGPPAELLRRPQFTLSLVGLDDGDALSVSDTADQIVEAIRLSSGDLVYLSAGEPVYIPTADGRPVFEIALSAIAN